MPATRRLAAILAADIAGYSRLVGLDEEGTLARLRALRQALLRAIAPVMCWTPFICGTPTSAGFTSLACALATGEAD